MTRAPDPRRDHSAICEDTSSWKPWPSTITFLAVLGATALLASCKSSTDLCEESAGALYERRIVPLLEADHPSSCSPCHAGGLELDDLLRPDACESMACLIAEGYVDLEHPDRSVILSFIERSEPESELITDQVMREEYEAFRQWIQHEAQCRTCADAACGGREASSCDVRDTTDAAFHPENDPGDCERTTLERLFRGTVYENRGRCSPCHFKEEDSKTPPEVRWLSRTGQCKVASLASLRAVEELGYMDLDHPEDSLLIQKPLAEFQGGLPHGGHDKIVRNDDVYSAFLYFISRYAACEQGNALMTPSAGGAAND